MFVVGVLLPSLVLAQTSSTCSEVNLNLKHEIYASRDRGGRTNPNHCKARGVQSAVRRKTAVPKSAAAVLSSSLTPPSSPPHVDEKVTPQSVSAQGVCVAKP